MKKTCSSNCADCQCKSDSTTGATPPSTWKLVPVTPDAAQLKSMAVRYDHGLGVDGFYDSTFYQSLPNALSHAQRLEGALRVMRQLYEEAVGEGFYQLPPADLDVAALLLENQQLKAQLAEIQAQKPTGYLHTGPNNEPTFETHPGANSQPVYLAAGAALTDPAEDGPQGFNHLTDTVVHKDEDKDWCSAGGWLSPEEIEEGWPFEGEYQDAQGNTMEGRYRLKTKPIVLTAEERNALERFCETCEDGEGYDVPKETMKQLAAIGVLGHSSRGIYFITSFGEYVRTKFPVVSGHEREVFLRRPKVSVDTPVENVPVGSGQCSGAPESGGPPCNPHPDAPHGFCRNSSHSLGRYVCECEGWIAPSSPAETE